MGYGWEGKKVRLVPLDKAKHFENALRWFNDEETTAWTYLGDFPMGRLKEEEYFEKHSKGDPSDIAFAVETLKGEHIGFTGMHDIDYRHGTMTSGSLIGEAKNRGKGYGADCARVRTRYAFHVLGLRLLLSHVMDGNDASLSMLLKAGYKECGLIPKRYWKRGAFRDMRLLYLSREDWDVNQRSD